MRTGDNHAVSSFAITMSHSLPICRNSQSWEKSNDGQGALGDSGKSAGTRNDNSAYPELGATGNPLGPHCTRRGVPFGDCVRASASMARTSVTENFANFVHYTAEVNSFMPTFAIPFLAWAATAAEFVLGIALILGVWPRWVALGSALLLARFGIAMAISFGIRSPLDYSAFSASATAVLLALWQTRKSATYS
jgi:uncharacterized membrane protein YphA (DoxX/SURF4 family)